MNWNLVGTRGSSVPIFFLAVWTLTSTQYPSLPKAFFWLEPGSLRSTLNFKNPIGTGRYSWEEGYRSCPLVCSSFSFKSYSQLSLLYLEAPKIHKLKVAKTVGAKPVFYLVHSTAGFFDRKLPRKINKRLLKKLHKLEKSVPEPFSEEKVDDDWPALLL